MFQEQALFTADIFTCHRRKAQVSLMISMVAPFHSNVSVSHDGESQRAQNQDLEFHYSNLRSSKCFHLSVLIKPEGMFHFIHLFILPVCSFQNTNTHLHKYTQTHPPTHMHKDNGAAAFLQRCLLCFVSKFNCNRNCNCNYCCTRASRQRKHTYLQCRQLLLPHRHLLAVVQANTQRHTCLSGN